jgi:hypothetical protein
MERGVKPGSTQHNAHAMNTMNIMKRCARYESMHTHDAHQHDDAIARDDQARVNAPRA